MSEILLLNNEKYLEYTLNILLQKPKVLPTYPCPGRKKHIYANG
jgi:hypothetical protein